MIRAKNMYYKGRKINSFPIDDETYNKIMNEKYVYKKEANGTVTQIPVNQLSFIKCMIV